MRPSVRRRRNSGFGMMEVLVSLGLLMVCAAGSVAMLVTSIISTSFSGSVQTAYRLGQTVLDRAMIEPITLLQCGGVAGSACQTVENNLLADGTTGAASGGNSVRYTRSCAVSCPPNGPRTISVTVSWPRLSGNGNPHSITVGVMRAPGP